MSGGGCIGSPPPPVWQAATLWHWFDIYNKHHMKRRLNYPALDIRQAKTRSCIVYTTVRMLWFHFLILQEEAISLAKVERSLQWWSQVLQTQLQTQDDANIMAPI